MIRLCATELLASSSLPHLANNDFHNKIAHNLESYKPPTDYKCHMFNGALSHIDTIIDKFTKQTEIAMTPTWEKMPFDYDKKATHIPPKQRSDNDYPHHREKC